MVFSDLLGLDTEKVMKLCIIHDLAESIMGIICPKKFLLEKNVSEKIMQ